MPHKTSFEIKTANDYFTEMLLPQHQDFISSNGSSRYALLTIILAYHMYEWVHKIKFTVEDFKAKYTNYQSMASEFDVARLITNGTKHFSEKEIETKVQPGFTSSFSNDFAKPLIIQYKNGSEVSADEFIHKIVDFWKNEKNNSAF